MSSVVREPETGKPSRVETKVMKPGEKASQKVTAFLRDAASGKPSYVGTIADMHNAGRTQHLLGLIGDIRGANPDFVAQYITDIQKENVEDVKRVIKSGVIVRHIEGNKIGFSVSGTEYLNHYQDVSGPETDRDFRDWAELVYSNNSDLVMQMRQVFEILWKSALPAESRIKQIEAGLESGETRIITDLEESTALGWELLNGVENELEIILASGKTVQRNAEMYDALVRLAKVKGVRVRILAPFSDADSGLLHGVEIRTTAPLSTGLAIYDRKKMLITQYVDPEAGTRDEAFLSNIYTKDRRTISGMMSLFDALWRESEMRGEESRVRTQAQLLQDIVTHDVRNYNQIVLASAELLVGQLSTDEEAQTNLSRMVAAVKGCTDLLEKADRLGRILSTPETNLASLDLPTCISQSVQLARDSHPQKTIKHEMRVVRYGDDGQTAVRVVADDLLNEAFVNVYSNCANYTEGNDVPIETILEEFDENRAGGRKRFWRVSISDHGVGVPDEVKGVFTRYRSNPKGRGLGLSIVHALVVERYSGELRIKDRVEDDYRKGACVQMLLPRAQNPAD